MRLFFLRNFWFLFVATVILLWACNNGNIDKPKPIQEPVATSQTAVMTGGMLDTLKVDSAAFAALPDGKLIFSFVFEANDVLTMHGWILKKVVKNYDSLPNIKLLKMATSTLPYGIGTYFGSTILGNGAVNHIQKALKDNQAQLVLFAPQKLGNNIAYKILVAKTDPTKMFVVTTVNTGIDVNPSPPKNF